MAQSKKPKNKTKERMKKQSNDLVTLAALGNGESGSKSKEEIGDLNKWLKSLKDGFTNITPQKNDVPFGGELPKFEIKVIAGNGVDEDTKKTTKKK